MDRGLRLVHGGPAWRRGRKTAGEQPGRRSSLSVLTSGSREGEGRCGGLAMGLTRARGVAEQLGDSSEVVAVVGLGK
jgi:hypothetical protein